MCFIFSIKNVPVLVFTVILNTSAFFVAILGWIISGEKVSCIEALFMIGSFGGVTFLVL